MAVEFLHEVGGVGALLEEFGPLAAQAGIPFFAFAKVKDDETIARVRDLQPDVIFVWGLSQLIPAELLAIPRQGCIGVHPTLLPRNRGRHPLIWTLVDGLSEGGLTFFYLDEGADSGDILWQRPFPVHREDDAASLYRKIEALAAEAIAEQLAGAREAEPSAYETKLRESWVAHELWGVRNVRPAFAKWGMWGGLVTLANGWQLELPEMAEDTRLPITVEARHVNRE